MNSDKFMSSLTAISFVQTGLFKVWVIQGINETDYYNP